MENKKYLKISWIILVVWCIYASNIVIQYLFYMNILNPPSSKVFQLSRGNPNYVLTIIPEALAIPLLIATILWFFVMSKKVPENKVNRCWKTPSDIVKKILIGSAIAVILGLRGNGLIGFFYAIFPIPFFWYEERFRLMIKRSKEYDYNEYFYDKDINDFDIMHGVRKNKDIANKLESRWLPPEYR